MTLIYKKPNHLKIISEATSNYQNTVLQPNCKNTVIENKKARLSYKHNFNFFKLKQNLNTTHTTILVKPKKSPKIRVKSKEIV